MKIIFFIADGIMFILISLIGLTMLIISFIFAGLMVLSEKFEVENSIFRKIMIKLNDRYNFR